MQDRQIPLPLDYAPPMVREHGLRDAHHKPLSAWAKGKPSHRRPPPEAWQLPLLELDRTMTSYAAIGLDIDGRDNVIHFLDAIEARRLPEPNWMTEREASGNVQAHYCLARPVHRGPDARDRPLQALARVAEYLTEAAHADPGYAGVLARNPMDEPHRDPRAADGPCRTVWRRREPYTLAELSRVVPFGWRRPAVVVSAIGRNVTVFRTLMRESGKPRNWGRPVAALAAALNDGIGRLFPDGPLDAGELAGIVASVERIQARNLASGRTQAGLSRIQAGRGRKGGRKPKRGTVRASARPDEGTNEAVRPWQAAGVSRRTWYYRQAKARAAEAAPAAVAA